MSWFPSRDSIERHLFHAEKDFIALALKHAEKIGRNWVGDSTPARLLLPQGRLAELGKDELLQFMKASEILRINELTTLSALCAHLRLFNDGQSDGVRLAANLKELAMHLENGSGAASPGVRLLTEEERKSPTGFR